MQHIQKSFDTIQISGIVAVLSAPIEDSLEAASSFVMSFVTSLVTSLVTTISSAKIKPESCSTLITATVMNMPQNNKGRAITGVVPMPRVCLEPT